MHKVVTLIQQGIHIPIIHIAEAVSYTHLMRAHISAKGKLPIPVGYFISLQPHDGTMLGLSLIHIYVYKRQAKMLTEGSNQAIMTMTHLLNKEENVDPKIKAFADDFEDISKRYIEELKEFL